MYVTLDYPVKEQKDSEVLVESEFKIYCTTWSNTEGPMRVFFQSFTEGSLPELLHTDSVISFASFDPKNSGTYTCAQKKMERDLFYLKSYKLMAEGKHSIDTMQLFFQ